MSRDFTFHDVPPAGGRARDGLAVALRAGSRWLAQLASRLAHRQARASTDPQLEFYAEAGAPEGALYVDGRRVGTVPGVNRL